MMIPPPSNCSGSGNSGLCSFNKGALIGLGLIALIALNYSFQTTITRLVANVPVITSREVSVTAAANTTVATTMMTTEIETEGEALFTEVVHNLEKQLEVMKSHQQQQDVQSKKQIAQLQEEMERLRVENKELKVEQTSQHLEIQRRLNETIMKTQQQARIQTTQLQEEMERLRVENKELKKRLDSSNLRGGVVGVNANNNTNLAVERLATTGALIKAPASAATSPTTKEIPRRIHLIYLSKGLGMLKHHPTDFLQKPQPYPSGGSNETTQQIIPQATLDIYAKWKKLHPKQPGGWEITLWDNKLVRQWLISHNKQDLLDHLSRIPIVAWMTDVFRFVLLEELGGIYLDADILPLRNMEPLLKWMNDENVGGTGGRKHKGAFSVCQDEAPNLPPIVPDPIGNTENYYDWSAHNRTNCKRLNNAVIGTIPHHPMITTMSRIGLNNSIEKLNNPNELKKIQRNTWKILFIAGPWQWDQIVKNPTNYGINVTATSTSSPHPPEVEYIRSKPFFPCHHNDKKCQRRHPETFAQDDTIFGNHLYEGSWK